jgi:hypothetical protein
MSTKNFSQANDWLKKRLEGRDEFMGSRNSFFKIFQHGIVYSFLEIKNKKLKTFFHHPLFVQKLRWKLKSLLKSKATRFQLNEIVMLDPGRVHIDEDGNHTSVYFNKIQKTLPKSKYTLINEDPKHGLPCDYTISDLDCLPFPSGDAADWMFKEVNDVAKKLRNSVYYSAEEKELILSCLHLFLVSYIRYLSIFQKSKIKKLFFIRHYHNEGIIAAAHDCGIETIELQHGLINKHDLYYVYDDAFQKNLNNAFFPNRILLFGQYWKDVLSKGAEWKPEQLIVAGDYLSSKVTEQKDAKKENVILVASQKTLHDLFIPRIKELLASLQNHPEWRIILKLHPFEKETEKYSELAGDRLEIAPLHSNISDYLEISKIQVSIYSTTFFDAIGKNVVNFAWTGNFLGGDYADALIEDGIAFLGNNTDIVSRFLEISTSIDKQLERTFYYSNISIKSFDV